MTNKLAQCFLGYAKGQQRYEGQVNDAAVDKAITGADGKAKFARESHYYDRDISQNAPYSQREQAEALFKKYTGVDYNRLGAFFRDPAALLGEDVVNRVHEIYLQHHTLEKPTIEAWIAEGQPEIQKLRAQVEAGLPANLKDYAAKYFNHHEDGGAMYPPGGDDGLLMLPVKNALHNLVNMSPTITIQNGLEFLPKALAHSSMSGGSPASILQAMSNLMRKTGGNPFAKLAEWDARGIYGNVPAPKPWNYLQHSENLLRNLSASLGEVLGQPPELAVEKVAFVPRMGNEPQVYWTSSDRNAVTLMRYSIAATKMYMNMLGQVGLGIKNGDFAQAGKAAGAFAMFSAMNAIQTGSVSALPAPVAFVLKHADPDTYEALKELDKENPALNLAKHLGMDIAEKSQPLGGFAIGLGQALVSGDIKNSLSSIGKIPMDLKAGEGGLATARLVDAVMGVGQLVRVPGVNLSTKRLSAAMVKQLDQDSEINLDYLQRAGEGLGLTTHQPE